MYALKLLWDILTVVFKALGLVWAIGRIPEM